MFNKMSRKGTALLLAAAMVSVLFTGCGKQEEPAGPAQQQVQKGKYVEKELTLPEGVSAADISHLFNVDGKLHMLVKKDNAGRAVWQEWEFNNNAFSDVTGQWLKELDVPYLNFGSAQILRDKEGASYLFAIYNFEESEQYSAHLWKSEDGALAVEITPEEWTVPNEEYDYYETPEDLVILDNGMLVAKYYYKTDYYLAEDGSLLKTIEQDPMQERYLNAVANTGDHYYLMAVDGNENVKNVQIFGTDSDTPLNTIAFAQESTGTSYMDVRKDGTMFIANIDGIFQCMDGSTNWEKLMEGVDTSMGMLDMWCRGMTVLDDGSFYISYGGEDDKAALMQYVFDPDAVTEITQVLNLYTVNESFLLQQAAVMFHKAHPEVMINIETGISRMEQFNTNIDYAQIFQELNTKLVAGKGPDILVMDNLDLDSFMEKGLLEDINDIVAPLEADGSLLSNITSCYLQEDGKRYLVPLQFGLVLSVGRDVDVKNMADIPSLADAMSKNDESLMGPRTPYELVEAFLPYFVSDIVKGKELDQEALKINLEYVKKIGENCGIIPTRAEDERPWGLWDIASKAKMFFAETDGFNQAMMPISAANLVNGTFTPFGNAFYPRLQVGIYSKTEKMDVAKEFIAFLLTSELQNQDFYEGFPVNSISLDYLAAKDRSNMEAYTMIDMGDGAQGEFAIKSFSDADAKTLTDACRNVDKLARKDQQILKVIAENIPGYLDGSQTIEKTIEGIEAGLRMYLAE